MDFMRILYSEISFVPNQFEQSTSSSPLPAQHHNNNKITTKQQVQQQQQQNHHNHSQSNANNCSNTNQQNPSENFQSPLHQLCDSNLIKLDWQQTEKIGGGLINVGNTCFLNSVLQCLTYCPPLYNFLVKLNGGHSSSCKINQFCMLCEMEKHIKRIKSSNGSPIKPVSIVQRLKYINRSFQFGRQEDAHEFLRYVIDHMWKACLINLDINCKTSKLDPRIKETTFINHIFGGYHRSQVLCLTCNSRSNTFDFFMDISLDIRGAKSIEEALKRFTQPETLENENAYKCGKCRKKVVAKKRFSVSKAPNVATFQLKRFDSDRIFGGKVTKFISYPEELDLRPYMSESNSKSPIKYQLSSVLVHVGHSSNSGHYFCFIKNSNGCWYLMDDSSVSVVNRNVVLQQQAYVLFYTRKAIDIKQIPSNGLNLEKNHSSVDKSSNSSSNGNTSPVKQNGNTTNNCLNKIATLNDSPKSQQLAKQALSESISFTNGTTAKPSQPQQDTNKTQATTNQPSAVATNATTSVTSSATPQVPTTQQAFLATWLGKKSKLEDDDPTKRKLNEVTDRDLFNEELDRGKTKKIKTHSREERFNNNNSGRQSFQNHHRKQGRFNHNNNNHNNNNNNNKRTHRANWNRGGGGDRPQHFKFRSWTK